MLLSFLFFLCQINRGLQIFTYGCTCIHKTSDRV
nr:MAG TPA: hypothetical protein [Caudoviricetes sp.]